MRPISCWQTSNTPRSTRPLNTAGVVEVRCSSSALETSFISRPLRQPESSRYFISRSSCLGARRCNSSKKMCRRCSLRAAAVRRTRVSVLGLQVRRNSSFTKMASLSSSDLMTESMFLMPVSFSSFVTHCSGSAESISSIFCSFSGRRTSDSKSGLYSTIVSLSSFKPEGKAALQTSPCVQRQ